MVEGTRCKRGKWGGREPAGGGGKIKLFPLLKSWRTARSTGGIERGGRSAAGCYCSTEMTGIALCPASTFCCL